MPRTTKTKWICPEYMPYRWIGSLCIHKPWGKRWWYNLTFHWHWRGRALMVDLTPPRLWRYSCDC